MGIITYTIALRKIPYEIIRHNLITQDVFFGNATYESAIFIT